MSTASSLQIIIHFWVIHIIFWLLYYAEKNPYHADWRRHPFHTCTTTPNFQYHKYCLAHVHWPYGHTAIHFKVKELQKRPFLASQNENNRTARVPTLNEKTKKMCCSRYRQTINPSFITEKNSVHHKTAFLKATQNKKGNNQQSQTLVVYSWNSAALVVIVIDFLVGSQSTMFRVLAMTNC